MPDDLVQQLLRWWPDQRLWQASPVPWVLGSLVLGVGARLVLWAATSRSYRLRTRYHTPAGHVVAWLGWMAWLVGPGYAALLLGVLSPRLMGLARIDWGAPFGYGLAFAGLAVAILVAAGVTVRQAGDALPAWPTLSAALAGSVLLAAEAGALQWHWAFYRGAAIYSAQELGASTPLVWGTWIAVGLAMLEGVLNPGLWHDLQAPGPAQRRMLRAVLLVATGVLFLLSRNFWLLWVTHALVAMILEPRLAQSHRWLAGSKKGAAGR